MKTIKEVEEIYDLQLKKIILEIKKNKAKMVLLQFPEGLKPYATAIVDFLREEFNNKVEFMIWMDNCFGACDVPVLGNKLEKKIDLVIQFGHSSLMPSY
jgi:2-(3-amino-3-carboxypropyl)histidine synthase